MTDQLDEMMTDLRARTVSEIRPPGVAAARRTVRRRRVASGVASACAVLAVVGVTVVLARQPAPVPAPVTADVTGLADTARTALPAGTDTADPPEPRNEPSTVLERPGELQRMAGSASIPPSDDFHIDSAFHLLVDRSYVLAAACSGTGELVIRVSRGRTAVADYRVPCSRPPIRHEFTMGRGAGQMSVSTRYRSAKNEPAPYAWAFIES